MAFTDTPNKLESAFIQRNASNTVYEQVNVSGSNLIFYHDSDGILTADQIATWMYYYNIGLRYPPIKIINETIYTLTNMDHTIIVSGSSPVTILLPSPINGIIYFIKNRNNYPIYIVPSGTDTIDGGNSLTSSFKNTSIQLQCSGSEWFIL